MNGFVVILIIIGAVAATVCAIVFFVNSAVKKRYRIIEVEKPMYESYEGTIYAIKEYKLWGLAYTGNYANKHGGTTKANSYADLRSSCLYTNAKDVEDALNLVCPPKIKGTSRTLKEIKMEGLIDGSSK